MKYLILFLFLSLSKLIYSQSFDSLIKVGDIYWEKHEYNQAIFYFSKAVATEPKNSKGYWYRGDAYRDSGLVELAIKDYSEAIVLEPGYWKHYKNRANCYMKIHKAKEAETDYSSAILLDINNPDLYILRGLCYQEINQNTKACDDYKKAYEIDKWKGKSYAKEIGCEWVKALVKPCQTTDFAIQKIEIDPFTGAIFISKGLKFDNFELKPEDGIGFLSNNYFGNESFKLKLLQPTGFCIDENEEVYTGIGFQVIDSTGKDLGGVDDLYKDKTDGLPAEYLKSLSITLGFQETEAMINGHRYQANIRFFDKKSKAEAWVYMPFILSAHTSFGNNISTSQSILGEGINGASIIAEVNQLQILQTKNKLVSNFNHLLAQTEYSLELSKIKNLGGRINYTVRVIDQNGKIIQENSNVYNQVNDVINLKVISNDLNTGNYYIWVRISDDKGAQIGLSIPVHID